MSIAAAFGVIGSVVIWAIAVAYGEKVDIKYSMSVATLTVAIAWGISGFISWVTT